MEEPLTMLVLARDDKIGRLPEADPYPDNGVALAAAYAEIERGRATVAEQAVALHLHAGKARWD
jgi:hypothetical protein